MPPDEPGRYEDRVAPQQDAFVVDRVIERVRGVFTSLDSLPYLGKDERADFRYYEKLLAGYLLRIKRKTLVGSLRPIDLGGNRGDLRFTGSPTRIGVFIGSFDPFQMTHLAMALRFLASAQGEADAVFVVPEGSVDPRKPRRSEYRFRYEILQRQLADVLQPLVVPLDLGEGADTIEIVRRIIALHPGSSLRLTHLIGSDTLPTALRLLPQDLAAWNAAAARYKVELALSLFVIRREGGLGTADLARGVRALGVRIVVDRAVIGTPSSTRFRKDRAITLVFPTEATLGSLELFFRYGMNKPWSAPPSPPSPPWSEFEI